MPHAQQQRRCRHAPIGGFADTHEEQRHADHQRADQEGDDGRQDEVGRVGGDRRCHDADEMHGPDADGEEPRSARQQQAAVGARCVRAPEPPGRSRCSRRAWQSPPRARPDMDCAQRTSRYWHRRFSSPAGHLPDAEVYMRNGELDNVGVERGLTSYEFICKTWTKEPQQFRLDPTHQTSGPKHPGSGATCRRIRF